MKLSELATGKSAIVVKVQGSGKFRKRIIEMGFVKGKKVDVILNAPLLDPVKYKIMDYEVSLRRSEAALIDIISEEEAEQLKRQQDNHEAFIVEPEDTVEHLADERGHTINVALIGNPNAGKTSLFNIASGAHEKVGNYSGVTVDAKEGHFDFNGYHFRIFDLPGTYSLSAYTPEEIYVRDQIFKTTPDVIINIVSASSLERNLYLTTQLIDMDLPMVIALNMYDELEKSGAKLDHQMLGAMLGAPMIPTIASAGINNEKSGLSKLFNTVIDVYEGNEKTNRHIHINHGGDLQIAIDHITRMIKDAADFTSAVSSRFFAIKFIEGDKEAEKYIAKLSNGKEILEYRDQVRPHIENEIQEDCESAIINAKYGFVAGALAETYHEGEKETFRLTKIIDPIVTHRIWGFPVFLLFMFIMFECTFILGAYPQDWIETGVDWLGNAIGSAMSDGPLKDLIVDGIISGVGGVLVFLPQILILYFFISIMEDSGYLSRAAFIMDKIMHRMGLHGKSFVPMLMGFGCNVPGIMATRTLESRNSRLITMLVTPFMSCSARLPIYLLFTAAFFPHHAGLMMMALYMLGIVMAIISARIFKKFLFKGEDVPFVMELPPYRMPTLNSVLHHMWEKSEQYLRKMGTLILFASVVVWALGYFPLPDREDMTEQERLEQSYIGTVGNFIEPAVRPLGFDWRLGMAVVSALPAKEIVVSTLNVLYNNSEESGEEDTDVMRREMCTDGVEAHTPVVAISFLIFILLSCPCIATVMAIRNESNSWGWALFSVIYNTVIAWVVSFIVYNVGIMLV